MTRERFAIRTEREEGLQRLTPTGELDIATVPILEAEFDAACRDGEAEMIVVDLTKLDFMDSTGIVPLLRMSARCEGAERLRIINGSTAVMRALDLSGVRGILPIISKARDPLAPLSVTEPSP
jgi:anti-anti-sigma factor